jgi:hypothetical protein
LVISTDLGNLVFSVMPSAFEVVVGGVRHPQQPQTGSNSSTIAADNNTV